jgi:nicotinamidase/pyrazinamidase
MKALLIVDVQNDFLPDGKLAVPNGDHVIPVINRLQARFEMVVATQDWHPENHGSFSANHENKYPGEFINLYGVEQILWPVHCVQHTVGADFHPQLDRKKWAAVFQKGTNPTVDSYSGFFDNHRRQDTGLSAFLKGQGVDTIYVTGLATDYCVKYTVLDSLSEGFDTYLVEDATKGVNLSPYDSERAITDMSIAGCAIIDSYSVI